MRKAKTSNELQIIPGVGKSIAVDLNDMGIYEVEELRGRNPEKMYQDFCRLRGQHIDRCMLYTFRCAVYYAETVGRGRAADPEKLKWWNWKNP